MSFINQFSRICFENCIVKDHFGSNGTAEFRKKTTFKGPVCFTSTLQMSTKEITVRVPQDFPTIQEALDSFAGRHAGCVKLLIAKGEYEETLSLEKFSSSIGVDVRDPNDPVAPDRLTRVVSKGLMIIGDTRRRLARAWVNGARFPGNSSRQREVLLETDVSGVGPFRALLASNFGGLVSTSTSFTPLQLSNPILGAPAPLAAFGGNAALIDRGGAFSFVLKSQNAENAGASFVIIANNNTAAPDNNIGMGGGPAGVTIPAADVSYNTGQALRAALISNPGMQVRLVNQIGGAYDPPMGTNYAVSNLSSPAPNKIQVVMSDAPLNDVNILAPPVLENPAFDDPRVGYKVGDKVHVASSNLKNFNDVQEVRTITGFESSTEGGPNNILVLDAALTVDVTTKGANFAVMPCVLIKHRDPKRPYALNINNCDVTLHGLWFDGNPNLPAISGQSGSMLVNNSYILMSSCALTDSPGRMGNGGQLECYNSAVQVFDGYRDSGDAALYCGGVNGVLINDNSWLGGSFITVTQTSSTGFTVSNGSQCHMGNIQVIGTNFLFLTGRSGLLISDSSSCVVNGILSVLNCFGSGILVNSSSALTAQNNSVQVECSYLPTGDFTLQAAVSVSGGSKVVFQDGDALESSGSANNISKITTGPRIVNNSNGDSFYGYASPNIGVLLRDCSELYSLSPLDLTGSDIPYRVLQNGKLAVDGEGNRKVHTVSGSLDHAYELQTLKSGGPALNLTLDPSEEYLGDSLFLGRTFCVYSDDAATAHQVSLTGANFYGCGFSGEPALQLDAGRGNSLLFYVQDASTVIVKNACGVSVPP